jgi:glycosyltransferase involved in cell wall biosynthesis
MKILITQETDWLKRNPIHQHHLAEILSLRGHEIRVIDHELQWMAQVKKWGYCRREIFNDIVKIYDGARVTVIRPGILRVPWLDNISLFYSHKKEIRRQIKEFAPDVIVGFGILNSYLASGAASRNNIPFIYYWVDVLHRLIPTRIFQPIGILFERIALRQSDMVLVINEGLKDVVVSLGASQEWTNVLRTGIDDKLFNPNNSDESLKTQLGLTREDIVLFFMGWLYRFSGLKEVARQLTESENRSVKLIVVGEGDDYEELKRIQMEHNLPDRLILTGKKPYQELPGLISTSDICILPAYPTEKIMQDIVPIKLYEYMVMQKPVISTRLRGVVREFGESNGVVYVDSPEDVIPKAIELVQSGQVEELGLKAREFAARNSWEKITDEFEEILEKAIKEKHK